MAPRRPQRRPFSANNKRNQELKPLERSYIAAAHKYGGTATQIAEDLQRPRSTIYSTLRNASSKQNFESRSRSGRPKIFTDRDKRSIIRLIKKHPFITLFATPKNAPNVSIDPYDSTHYCRVRIWQMACSKTARIDS